MTTHARRPAMDTPAPTDIDEARAYVEQAIADLKAAGVAIPLSLHRAAHALHYAVAEQDRAEPAAAPVPRPLVR